MKLPTSDDWERISDSVAPGDWYPCVNFRESGYSCRIMNVSDSNIASASAPAVAVSSQTATTSFGNQLTGIVGTFDPRRSAEMVSAFQRTKGSGSIDSTDPSLFEASGICAAEAVATASDGVLQWTVECRASSGDHIVGAIREDLRNASIQQRGVTIRGRDGRVYRDGRKLRMEHAANLRFHSGDSVTFRLELGDGTKDGGVLSVRTSGEFVQVVDDLEKGPWRPMVMTHLPASTATFHILDVFYRSSMSVIRVKGGSGAAARQLVVGPGAASRRGGASRGTTLTNELHQASRKGDGVFKAMNRITTSKNFFVRSRAGVTEGGMKWSIKYVDNDTACNVAVGAINGDPRNAAFRSSDNKAVLICGSTGNLFINGSSQDTDSSRQFGPGDTLYFQLRVGDSSRPGTLHVRKNMGKKICLSDALEAGGEWHAAIACFGTRQTVELQSVMEVPIGSLSADLEDGLDALGGPGSSATLA